MCGALVLAQLLFHCKEVLYVPTKQVFAWTDSTIVLNWIRGSPRRFKIFVGNRVSKIMDLLPPDRWNHVASAVNPADCASRGLFPVELLNHRLWWSGPEWLRCCQSKWPKQSVLQPNLPAEEVDELCSLICTTVDIAQPLVPFDQFSVFSHLKRVTAWVVRFI